MTNGQKKMLSKMSKQLESYDNIMRLLTDKVNSMKEKIEFSFNQNPPADDEEKEYIDDLLDDMQKFIEPNMTSLLYLSERLDVE